MAFPATKPTTASGPVRRRSGYVPPRDRHAYPFPDLLKRIGRAPLENRQLEFLGADGLIFYSGELDLLEAPTVSIVGTREVSDAGWKRATQLARELARTGITIVSGLAKGVDTAALTSAVSHGGRVAAVIGTPLDKAYPAENVGLQQEIYANHLLISPFREGGRVFRSNFPARNRVMAAISDATVIIEASDTSGTLHQAAECQRLGRWLFILRSVVDDKSIAWPARFIGKPFVEILDRTEDLLERIR
jgi:DNA protecting protein DprA